MSTHVSHRETVDRAAVQLHVLLVTWTPSEARMQALLSALCPFLRRAGHSVLVCVPPGSLDPEHAAKADDAGIEYVFVPPHLHTPFSPLRGWAVMWRQFKPNLVHVFPDVPPSIGLKVVRAAQSKLRRRIPVIVQVDAGVDQVIAGEWQPHAQVAEGSGKNQQVMVSILRKATQIACTDSHSLWVCRETLRLPAFRCSVIGSTDPYRTSSRTGALALLASTNTTSDRPAEYVRAALRALMLALLHSDTTELAAYLRVRRELEPIILGLPGGIGERVHYVKGAREWLTRLGKATVVVAITENPAAQKEIGAAHACGVPILRLQQPAGETAPGRQAAFSAISFSPSEVVEAVYDREAGGSGDALVGETNTQRNIETDVTHLYRIYEGVHLRES